MKTSDPDITSIPGGCLGANYIQVSRASIIKDAASGSWERTH